MDCLFTKLSSAFCIVFIFSDASRKNTIVKTNIMLLAKRKYNFRLSFFIMADLLMKNISAYQQTKAVYAEYKKAKDKEKFLRGNESSIIIHEAAAKTLQAARNGGKLPDFKKLHTEYKELTEKKDKLYQEYGKLKKKVKQYDTIKQNVDSILRQAKAPEQERGKGR